MRRPSTVTKGMGWLANRWTGGLGKGQSWLHLRGLLFPAVDIDVPHLRAPLASITCGQPSGRQVRASHHIACAYRWPSPVSRAVRACAPDSSPTAATSWSAASSRPTAAGCTRTSGAASRCSRACPPGRGSSRSLHRPRHRRSSAACSADPTRGWPRSRSTTASGRTCTALQRTMVEKKCVDVDVVGELAPVRRRDGEAPAELSHTRHPGSRGRRPRLSGTRRSDARAALRLGARLPGRRAETCSDAEIAVLDVGRGGQLLGACRSTPRGRARSGSGGPPAGSAPRRSCRSPAPPGPPPCSWARQRQISARISGARPSVASSRISRRGLVISARPIASICCSPPESRLAMLSMRSASRGNSAHTLSKVQGSADVAAVGGGGDQVLARGQVRKHLPSLRHQADAQLGHAVGRQPADLLAVEPDRAGGRRRQPHDRAHGGGLAHAVAAHQGHHLAGRDR